MTENDKNFFKPNTALKKPRCATAKKSEKRAQED